MQRLSRRFSLASSAGESSRYSIFPAALICMCVFVAQARAGKISPVIGSDDVERGGHFFTVQLHEQDEDSRQTASIQRGHVSDREAYTRRLTFKIDNYHPTVTPTSILGGATTLGSLDTKGSDPVSTVPEPSSLLLMSAGLLGFGTLLRSRLAAKGR